MGEIQVYSGWAQSEKTAGISLEGQVRSGSKELRAGTRLGTSTSTHAGCHEPQWSTQGGRRSPLPINQEGMVAGASQGEGKREGATALEAGQVGGRGMGLGCAVGASMGQFRGMRETGEGEHGEGAV